MATGNFSGRSEFIRVMYPYAIKAAQELGGVDPIALLTQWDLESGGGNSVSGDYNYFGMKAGSSWKGGKVLVKTKENIKSQKELDFYRTGGREVIGLVPGKTTVYYVRDYFKSYSSIDEAVADKIKLLKGNRYTAVRQTKTSDEYYRAMQASGYATATDYSIGLKNREKVVLDTLNKLNINPVRTTTATGTTTTTPVTTTSTTQTQQQQTNGSYIEKTYVTPFKNAPNDVKNQVLFSTPQTEAKRYFNDYIGKIRPLDISDIENDMLLVNSLTSQQTKRQDEVKTVLDGKLTSFSPDAKYALISEGLFELYPDTMRNKISENSTKGGSNPNFSHAWRAPGKVSITADLTIPGISGLRIGQIFWVDKISDAYKEYGAFQLLGLTETIDMSRGWTTSIHSRFNVLPRKGNERYLTDTVNNGNTSQNPTEAKPQT